MHRARCLAKALHACGATSLAADSQVSTSQINVAARLFSSAASTSRCIPVSHIARNGNIQHQPRFTFPQQHLTSLLVTHHARTLSTDEGDSFAKDPEAAASATAFDPSMVLDAVAGSEEGSWLSAREDCWFFNRYMQSILRFAQETTGLPWYE